MSGTTLAPQATRRGLAMGILIFASFMDLLDVTIVQVALPAIRADLGCCCPSAPTCSVTWPSSRAPRLER